MPENLISRDEFSRSVPCQPAHLHTLAESGAYLRDSSRVPRRRPFLCNRHTPSGQSRAYRVMQLRTDGVHCRESAGTGPVNLKVVPNECCLGRSPWTNHMRLSFPRPLLVWSGHVVSTSVHCCSSKLSSDHLRWWKRYRQYQLSMTNGQMTSQNSTVVEGVFSLPSGIPIKCYVEVFVFAAYAST